MQNRIIALTAFLLLFFCACTKTKIARPGSSALLGTWTLAQVCANDHWGGPLYWQNADATKQARFTADNRYYRKDAAETAFTLIGTYTILTDSTLQLTPAGSATQPYTLQYAVSPGSFLELRYSQFEGIVAEKFQRDGAVPQP